MSAVQTEQTAVIRLPFSGSPRVELDEREADGVSVVLTWTRGADVVAVTVGDARTGDSFELVVAENEQALDVFHHPFAYARARGVELLGDRPGAGVAVGD